MGIAAEIAAKDIDSCYSHLKHLEDYFLTKLHSISSNFIRNGNSNNCLPGLISISFKGHKSDILMAKLDRKNIAVSNGSACNTGNIKPSNILKEMGIGDDLNLSTLRISFGKNNNEKEIDKLIEALEEIL